MPGTAVGTSQVLIHPGLSTALAGRRSYHRGGEGACWTGGVRERPRGKFKKWEIVQMVISEVFELVLLRF